MLIKPRHPSVDLQMQEIWNRVTDFVTFVLHIVLCKISR